MDGKINRCFGDGDKLYENYHDREWGVPVKNDDRLLFEMLILEGAHAGLSWLIVLKKRENYRNVFHNFNVDKVASMTDEELESALLNPGIIRNRLKVYSARRNAIVYKNIQTEFKSFSNFLWAYVNGEPIINDVKDMSVVPSKTNLSDKLSKDLKMRGMNFVGSTIIYAYLQAVGVVNDHQNGCLFKFKD